MSSNIIPTDQSTGFDLVKALSTLDQKAIIRPNNPPPGIGGFLFDIRGDEWVELESEITDHWTDKNIPIQDGWALRPERVTVRGMIAELTSAQAQPARLPPPANPLPANIPMMPVRSPASLTSQVTAIASSAARLGVASLLSGTSIRGALQNAGSSIVANAQARITDSALGAVRSLLQPDSVTALLRTGIALPTSVQNAVNVLKAAVPKSAGAVINALKLPGTPAAQQLLAGSKVVPNATGGNSTLFQSYTAKQPTPPKATRQSSAFLFFMGLWQSRTLVSVETPWGIWTDMAILSMRSEQPEETKDRSDFTVTFKKMRFAQDVTVQLGQLAGRNALQSAAGQPSQNGNAGQQAITQSQEDSILYQWAHGP